MGTCGQRLVGDSSGAEEVGHTSRDHCRPIRFVAQNDYGGPKTARVSAENPRFFPVSFLFVE